MQMRWSGVAGTKVVTGEETRMPLMKHGMRKVVGRGMGG